MSRPVQTKMIGGKGPKSNVLGKTIPEGKIVKSESTLNGCQLSTHLPDIVVYVDHTKEMPHQSTFQGVLMFLDISGFTALCEKYSMNSKNGTDNLTKTLNGYLGTLVHEIIHYDGDVLKYAGDAILTLWQVKSYAQMKATVLHVLKCAMTIQKKCGEWNTDVGVKLKVKIGISAGTVTVSYIGNEEYCHYVTLGRAVEAVNLAEKFCTSGDVIISPTAWCHISSVIGITCELMDDDKHVKVEDISEMEDKLEYEICRTKSVSTPVQESASAPSSSKPKSSSGDALKPSLSISKRPSSFLGEKKPVTKKPSITNVRKATLETTDPYVCRKLELYIAPPVLRKMREHQPLEYLSEMRQVTIVFINLVLEEVSKSQQCMLLQESFKVIYSMTKTMQGCMNKIFMFDKGCTFLVIFGLPGFKHEQDCAHALQCAYRMKEKLDQIPQLVQTSIGVTTGSSFCGVCGHDDRHEYTVIGRKVNLAARLMMYYPGKVTCDNDTFHHSRLARPNFIPLETKAMKGLKNIGTIREFKEVHGKQQLMEALKIQDFEQPLIGRQREMDIFLNELQVLRKHPDKATQRQVIVFEGEAGIGKTRMMDAVIVKAMDKNFRVVSCRLNMHDAKTPFFAVKTLLMEMLDFDYDQSHQERENFLHKTFKDPFIIENLSMLNDLLYLKLPQNEKFFHMDSQTRNDLFHSLLFKIVHEMCAKIGYVIFAIDDAHFMDPESWEMVSDLGHDMRSLVMLTIRLSVTVKWCATAQQVLASPTTLHIPLHGLGAQYLSALACQFLNVVELPRRLDLLLRQRSHGVPSWCEQLINEMYYDGILIVVPAHQKRDHRKESSVTPHHDFLIRKFNSPDKKNLPKPDDKLIQEQDIPEDSVLSQMGITDPGNEKMICIIAPDRDLKIGIPDSIKGMIQARIDRMEETEQMIVKCAAILGMSFPRRMLEAILPKLPSEWVHDSIQRLMESGIFQCARAHPISSHQGGVHSTSHEPEHRQMRASPECKCPPPPDTDDSHLRTYGDCQLLRFQSQSIQETAYDIFLANSRRALHVAAAEFLQSQAHRCAACGGGGFIHDELVESQRLSKPEAAKPGAAAGIEPTQGRRRSSALQRSQVPTFNVMRMTSQQSYALEAGLMGANSDLAANRRGSRRVSLVRNTIRQSISHKVDQLPDKPNTMEQPTPSVVKSTNDSLFEDYEEEEFDMRECKCLEILTSVYPQLVYHWRAAGNLERTIHYLMEAGAASLATYDNLQALSYLREVSDILNSVKEGENPFEGETHEIDISPFDEWEKARLESLIGQALYHMGQVDESIPHFNTALKILGNPQPQSKVSVHFRMLCEGFRQWRHTQNPRQYLGKANQFLLHRMREQNRCLSHLFQEYIVSQEEKRALVTALQQVNLAEAVNDDIQELVLAYTSMIQCCLLKNWKDLAQQYEHKAQIRCGSILRSKNPEDLVVLAHLYVTSLNMRLVWGRIAEAVDVGFVADRLTKKLHNNDLQLQLLPQLAQSLLLSNRIIHCVEVLEDLHYIVEETDDLIGITWYYNCCLDLLLQAGFQLENQKACIDFAMSVRQNATFHCDHLPLYYLAACLVLWYTRKDNRGLAEAWKKVASENVPPSSNSYLSVQAVMKLLEAKLLCLARVVTQMDKVKSRELMQVIVKDFRTVEKACIKIPVFKPRLLHFQAYYSAIFNNKSDAINKLNQCVDMATKMGNILEMQWAEHSRLVWFDPSCDLEQRDFWLTHAESELLDWHMAKDMEEDATEIKFSLPLPQWFVK